MTPRPTPLLGFREPSVKNGELTLPVLTRNGEWAALVGTVGTFRSIASALDIALTEAGDGRQETLRRQGYAGHAAKPVQQPCASIALAPHADRAQVKNRAHHKAISPERRALYLAAHRDFLAGRHSTRSACARYHALPYGPWLAWLNHHRDEVVAELATAPALKPSGRIL